MGDVIQGPWKARKPRKPRAPREQGPSSNHPAYAPVWASDKNRRRTAEERRAAIVGNRPKCSSCEVFFDLRYPVPKDDLCGKCRAALRELREVKPPPADPSLF